MSTHGGVAGWLGYIAARFYSCSCLAVLCPSGVVGVAGSLSSRENSAGSIFFSLFCACVSGLSFAGIRVHGLHKFSLGSIARGKSTLSRGISRIFAVV